MTNVMKELMEASQRGYQRGTEARDTFTTRAWLDAEKELETIKAAIDVFSKATSLPGGPSLAMQRHEPTWNAWKALCHILAGKK